MDVKKAVADLWEHTRKAVPATGGNHFSTVGTSVDSTFTLHLEELSYETLY